MRSRTTCREPLEGSDATNIWTYLKRRLNYSEKPRRRYLSHQIEQLAGRLDVIKGTIRGESEDIGRYDATLAAIKEARRGLTLEHNNHAMFALHDARQLFVGLQSPQEMYAQISILQGEANTPQFEGLEGLINENLGIAAAALDDNDTERAVAFLESAMKIRDNHVEDQFISKSRLSFMLLVLAILLGVGTLAILLSFGEYCAYLSSDGARIIECENAQISEGGTAHRPLWMIALLGALGATLSSMMSFSSGRKIPDLFTSVSSTLVRPMIGALSGLIGFCVMSLGFIDIGQKMSALFLIIFAFGFSERLVLGAINRVDFRIQS